ncbi:MAG: glycosyltransferase family 4 protein [Hymenobacteraceae bacterium]|nr:glycosyltransferase family 4 protein [Hymenobacteraceae bacterium]
MRIAFVINTSWNIFNFRMSLVRALQAEGHEVLAIAPPDDYSARLVEAGCRFVPLPMANKGTRPDQDFGLMRRLAKIYRQERPDVVLHYTIKPNIYGTLAARLAGVPCINNVSGLGTVFIVRNFVSRIALALYRLAFRFPATVFFQNPDDRDLFLEHHLLKPEICGLLPGSGVDTARFRPAPTWQRGQPFTLLMIARVLYEKGIVEYFEAARAIKATYGDRVRCLLLGGLDEQGGIGVPRATFEGWLQDGAVEWLGTSDDVAAVIQTADCVVLPSYREGTPKTLLEAAAMGKPLVTTDVPGCREVVVEGENGFLCPARDGGALGVALNRVVALSDAELRRMGAASRELAVRRFDQQVVIDRYLDAISRATDRPSRRAAGLPVAIAPPRGTAVTAPPPAA